MFAVVDIGCIECGEGSNVLGVFSSREQAEVVMGEYKQKQAVNWHGQHDFFIQEIEMDKVYPSDYRSWAEKWMEDDLR